MKTIPKLLSILTVGFILLATPGCKTVNTALQLSTTQLSEQTTEQVIVNGEKAANIADDAMNTLLKIESEHHDAIMKLSPKVFEYCDYLRSDANNNGTMDGLDAEITLRTAIKSFKTHTDASHRATVIAAYNTIKDIIRDCRKYTAVALPATK